MRSFSCIFAFNVDVAVKILAFILLAIGTVALSYGNAPAKRIKDCENAGSGGRPSAPPPNGIMRK